METTSNSSTENLFSFESVLNRIGANRGRDDAFFICTGGPLSPTRIEIPRYRSDLIAEHKQNCDKCLQTEKERKEERQRELDTEQRIQYCRMMIDKAKIDIAAYQDRKKAVEEKKAKGEALDAIEEQKLRISLYDSNVAETVIKRETEELDRLKGKKKEKEEG